MEAFKFDEQINIFDMDIMPKESKIDRKKKLAIRKEKEKKRLYHTLNISNVLEKHCKGCCFNDFDKYKSKCLDCPFHQFIRIHAKGLEDLTNDKIVKESWIAKRGDNEDPFVERLYKYETTSELENDFTKEDIIEMRKTKKLVEIAQEIDAYYLVLKNFVNKHKAY